MRARQSADAVTCMVVNVSNGHGGATTPRSFLGRIVTAFVKTAVAEVPVAGPTAQAEVISSKEVRR